MAIKFLMVGMAFLPMKKEIITVTKIVTGFTKLLVVTEKLDK